jgi:hypothetical protein
VALAKPARPTHWPPTGYFCAAPPKLRVVSPAYTPAAWPGFALLWAFASFHASALDVGPVRRGPVQPVVPCEGCAQIANSDPNAQTCEIDPSERSASAPIASTFKNFFLLALFIVVPFICDLKTYNFQPLSLPDKRRGLSKRLQQRALRCTRSILSRECAAQSVLQVM